MRFFAAPVVICVCSVCYAQNPNVTLIANVDDYSTVGYSDCWGYVDQSSNEYALLGVRSGVSIIDVTDPSNATEVDFVPYDFSSWYDIKTYQNYMYVSTEAAPEVLIVDLSPLPDSASVVGVYTGFSTDPHNIYIDTQMGILYGIEDFNFSNPVRIISLSNPESPIELSTLGVGLGTDAHDVFARDSVLYVAEGNNGSIGIFDVSDPTNPSLLQRVPIPSPGYVHNVWVSEDNSYMISTEETPDKTVKLWNIQDLNNITLVDEYLGGSRLAHNAFIKNGYAHLSHYESGLTVVDMDDPTDIVEVGNYDTYPSGEGPGFNGAWGVYPFIPSGLIFISDIQTGLYILEFDGVRAGGIEGTITDLQTGAPIPDVDVEFVEASKITVTNPSGFYSLRTFEGSHTIIFSKLGYFSDTLMVSLPAGPNIVQDVSLDPNLAAINVSEDSLGMVLPIDTVAVTQIIVSNVGPSGRLDYTIDDINGPPPLNNRIIQRRRTDWHNFKFDLCQFRMSDFEHAAKLARLNSVLGDTIITDPTGDIVFGSGPDIIGVFAAVTSSDITFDFEFLDSLNTDSAFASLSLDTDFDSNTGAFPGGFGFNLPAHNIGSEYDVLLDVSGNILGSPLTAYAFIGANSPGGGQAVFSGGISLNANIMSTTMPLSAIGNDDGNMAVAGYVGHIDNSINVTSLDYMPNMGNGTVGVNPLGDLPWLLLSLANGSLLSGQSDTVIVTFDTHGLEQGGVFSGFVVVQSNDINQPVVSMPVTLLTEPVVGISNDPILPKAIRLEQNYPNPFNPRTTIQFTLPQSIFVTLKIYNALGQTIQTLLKRDLEPGKYSIGWDPGGVASGVYYYRLNAGEFTETRKMLVLK